MFEHCSSHAYFSSFPSGWLELSKLYVADMVTRFCLNTNSHMVEIWANDGYLLQFVPHCLRHTCASRLVQREVNLKVVQQWMGQKSIQITLRYAHLTPSNLMDAVQILEAPTLTLLKKAR